MLPAFQKLILIQMTAIFFPFRNGTFYTLAKNAWGFTNTFTHFVLKDRKKGKKIDMNFRPPF